MTRSCARCHEPIKGHAETTQVTTTAYADNGSGNPEHPVRLLTTYAGVLCDDCTDALILWIAP